ncbi:fructose-bisphosphate aldolase-lysine N-methyltransferase, chloroplastic [Tanacetum coccineum]
MSTFFSTFTSPNPLKPKSHIHQNHQFSVKCSATSASLPPSVQTFWKWLNDEKVVSSKSPAKPGMVTEGLGLVAQRDIGRNEVVLEVPKKFWINSDMVLGSEIGRVCDGLKPWISVALFLIREKLREDGGGAYWRSYIDILPEFTDSTIFWSEEELSEIEGTQLLSTTLSVKEYVKNEFLQVQEQVISPNKRLFPFEITLEDFIWAFGILRSRAFSRLRGQNLVLIPLADLINHSASITTEYYAYEIKGVGLFSRDQIFSLRSPIPVKAGQQVLIQYDLNKSNAELALDYGFIESTPDRNTYTLTLQISESDPYFDDKLDIAETNGTKAVQYFDITLGRPLPPKMLPYLRLVALGGTDAFLLESIFRNSVWDHLELPVSRDNEEVICQVVRSACQSALSSYRTTIEEDEKLKGGNISSRLEIAIGIRAGEKMKKGRFFAANLMEGTFLKRSGYGNQACLSMELRLVVLIVTLLFLSTLAKSIRFEIQSGIMRCISDDIKIHSMTVGQYSVVNPHEGHPLPEHHKIYVALYSEKGNEYHKENAVESGKFALAVEEDGKHTICFATINHQPKVNTSVELNWRSGVAAKDWSNVAKKGSIDAMELELKKMEATTTWIREEMTYLGGRRDARVNHENKLHDGLAEFVVVVYLLVCGGRAVVALEVVFRKEEDHLIFILS